MPASPPQQQQQQQGEDVDLDEVLHYLPDLTLLVLGWEMGGGAAGGMGCVQFLAND